MIKKFEEFNNKSTQKPLSNDLDLFKNIDLTKFENIGDEPISIIGIQDVSLTDPTEDMKEAIVINADLGGNEVKRGDSIWITALVKKNNYNMSSFVVLKVRISDIYQSLTVLNKIIKK